MQKLCGLHSLVEHRPAQCLFLSFSLQTQGVEAVCAMLQLQEHPGVFPFAWS